MSLTPTRREHDLLGERAVPDEAYWGIHTLRAMENFQISGTTLSAFSDLVRALGTAENAAAAAGLADALRSVLAGGMEQIGEGADEITALHVTPLQ